jgi:alginate O-acetyltransferase complex protein AlgI
MRSIPRSLHAAGVWFGIRMNFIVWGLYIAAFILLEKWFLGRYLERIPRFFTGIYTFCVTMLSMVIFSADSLGEMLRYFGAMFGFSAIFSTAETAYDISGSVIPLIAGAVLLTNFMSVLIHKLRRRSPSVGGAYDLVMSTVLLALCTAYLL